MGFIRFNEIKKVEFDEAQYLKTGIKQLDSKICGFGLGHLVILTGPRAGGKTTLIGQILCNFIEQGFAGLLCSFEMANSRLQRWLTVQALGKDNLVVRQTATGTPISYPKNESIERAAVEWFGRRLMVYDNQSFNADEVSRLIDDQVKANPLIKFVVLDNLMKIDFAGRSDNKYEAQSSFVKKLQAYAQTKGICVILVAHPNKVKTIPRIEDIGGSGDIINTADTVIFVHRVTEDFKKRADEYFGWKETAAELKVDNLIEIVKDREFGDDNSFIGVFFEPTAKRFLNVRGENVIYSFDVRPYQPRIMAQLVEITDDDGENPF